MSGIQNPVDIKDIGKFEHQNNNSFNVYGYQVKKIFSLYITMLTVSRDHMNLLYNTVGETTHYVLVKDLSRLVSRQYNNNKDKKYFCQCCFHGCASAEVFKTIWKNATYTGYKESSSQKLTTRRVVTKSNLQKQNTNYVYLFSSTWI